MKLIRWFLFGASLLVAGVVVTSCGQADKCTPSNCQGCCTADGRCDPGNQVTACGLNAGLCQVCSATDQCQGGFCTPLISNQRDGGSRVQDGGTTDGGDTCNAANCPSGCCAAGQCQPSSATTCGVGGAACQTCAANLACTSGTCVDPSCSGCVNNVGTCVTVAQQTSAQCGVNGAACMACPSGQTCVQGTCQSGSCNSSNCSGCCANGICQPGSSTGACGIGGNACTACASGQSCQNGSCQSTTSTGVGTACSTNANCSALGTGAVCKQSTSSGNATYTSGYCTKPCTQQGECGTGAECYYLAELGEGGTFCYDLCSMTDLCRGTGYECLADNSGNGFCWISPIPMPPTAPANLIGSSCTSEIACQAGGAYPAGGCIPATDSNGPTGFTGGYCVSTCNIGGSASCGSTATCLQFPANSGTLNLCVDLCAAPGQGQSDCRAGYVCEPGQDQKGAAIGFCWPNCNNVAGSCGNGTCLATGYCQ